MAYNFFKKIFLVLISLFLFSCVTNKEPVVEKMETEIVEIENISEIEGFWKNEENEIENPLIINEEKYFRISKSSINMTEILLSKNENENIESLWAKRFSLFEPPKADEKKIEKGFKIFRQDDQIFCKETFLIPVEIIQENLSNFKIQIEKKNDSIVSKKLLLSGTLKFDSQIFEDISFENCIFERGK